VLTYILIIWVFAYWVYTLEETDLSFSRSGVTAIKLRKKLPLLLERVGVRRIKNKAKSFI
jgi:hypothetical protein